MRRGPVLLFCVFVAACLVAKADQVTLKNGGIFTGILLEQNDETVTLQTETGTLVLPQSLIEKIESTHPSEAHIQMGKSLMEAGMLDAAQEHFEKARANPASASQARWGLEEIAIRRSNQREEDIHAILQLTKHQIEQKQYNEAVEEIDLLLNSKYPDDDFLLKQRGEIRLLQARDAIDHIQIKKAQNLLVMAQEDGCSRSSLHILLASLDRLEGRFSQALEEFRLAALEASQQEKALIEAEINQMEAMIAGTQAIPDYIPRPAKPPKEPPKLTPELLWVFIEKAGRDFEVDPLLVEALISAESSFRPEVVSHVGAQGLMQLMPGTAKDMGVEDPFDPEQNVRGGTRYLSLMLDEFDGDVTKALAAYNAGPHKVKIYKGIPPYKETQRYVPKVLRRYNQLKQEGSQLAQAG